MTSPSTHYGFLIMSSIPGKDIQQYALAYQYIQREHIDSQGIKYQISYRAVWDKYLIDLLLE